MVEHWSPASEDLRFDTIPHVVSEFFFSAARSWQDEKPLSLFLYRAQNLTYFLFYLQYFLIFLRWEFEMQESSLYTRKCPHLIWAA